MEILEATLLPGSYNRVSYLDVLHLQVHSPLLHTIELK